MNRRSKTRPGSTLRLECLESRQLQAFDFLNPFNAVDVDDNGFLVPLDALIVINEINSGGSRPLPPTDVRPKYFLDVSGDRQLAPVDALQVINQINLVLGSSSSELVVTASLAPESDPNGNGVVLLSRVAMTGQTQRRAAVRVRDEAGLIELFSVADSDGRFRFDLDLAPGTTSLQIAAVGQFGAGAVAEREARRGDVVLDWNASLLNVIRDWTTLSNDPYPNRIVTERPPVAARNLAMIHAAMFDAINATSPTHEPYQFTGTALGASPAAAAAAAAHRVAIQLYRDADERAVFDAALSEALATVADSAAKNAGIALGQQVGDTMLALRAADGVSTAASYTPGSAPGDWNRTFPDFLPPLLPQWPNVKPFAMTNGAQFRPAPPPQLDSSEYAAAVDEVLRLGALNSSTRTADQTEIALFWADGGGTSTPPGHWNQIAADVALAQNPTLANNARLFALLNLALADSGIAAWDAKYAFDLWRPIDAVRRADTDGNLATSADPTWTPLLKTPPFPTYTSGHSTFSGAAEAILTSFFGANYAFRSRSDGHTGFTQRPLADTQIVIRTFASFASAADEAGRSRVFGGIHFDFDNTAGLAAGRAIGQHVLSTKLLPKVATP